MDIMFYPPNNNSVYIHFNAHESTLDFTFSN